MGKVQSERVCADPEQCRGDIFMLSRAMSISERVHHCDASKMSSKCEKSCWNASQNRYNTEDVMFWRWFCVQKIKTFYCEFFQRKISKQRQLKRVCSHRWTTLTLFYSVCLFLLSFVNCYSSSSSSSSSSLSSSFSSDVNKSGLNSLPIGILSSHRNHSESSIESIVKSLRNSSSIHSPSISSSTFSTAHKSLPLEGSHLTINIPNQSIYHGERRGSAGIRSKTKRELDGNAGNDNGQSNKQNNNDDQMDKRSMILDSQDRVGTRFKHSVDEDDEEEGGNGEEEEDEDEERNNVGNDNSNNDTSGPSQKSESGDRMNHRTEHDSRDDVDFVMHSPRTVNTKYGVLQGVVMTFVRYSNSSSATPTSLTPVEAFLGVPYATPPSGNLRFMPPVAPLHWRGVRQANHPSSVCPQRPPDVEQDTEYKVHRKFYEQIRRQKPFLRNQSEDCLYLNIHVPFEQYFQQRHQFRPHQKASNLRKHHQSSRSKAHQSKFRTKNFCFFSYFYSFFILRYSSASLNSTPNYNNVTNFST